MKKLEHEILTRNRELMRYIIAIVVMVLHSWLFAPQTLAAEPAWKKPTQIKEILLIARTTKKPVMFHFSATWCPPCRRLKRKVFHDPKFTKEASKFVLVEIDVDKHPKLVKHFGVTTLPYDVFFHSDSTLLAKTSSPTDAFAYGLLLKRYAKLNSIHQKAIQNTRRTRVPKNGSRSEPAAFHPRPMQ